MIHIGEPVIIPGAISENRVTHLAFSRLGISPGVQRGDRAERRISKLGQAILCIFEIGSLGSGASGSGRTARGIRAGTEFFREGV